MTRRKCCVSRCKNSSDSHTHFSFPNVSLGNVQQFERCLQWIKASGNVKLLAHDPTYLSNHYFVCVDHFSNDSFAGASRKKLRKDSYPSQMINDSIPAKDLDTYFEKVRHLFPLNFSFNTCEVDTSCHLANEHVSILSNEGKVTIESCVDDGSNVTGVLNPYEELGEAHSVKSVEFEFIASGSDQSHGISNQYEELGKAYYGKSVSAECVRSKSCEGVAIQHKEPYISEFTESGSTESHTSLHVKINESSSCDQPPRGQISSFIKRRCCAKNCDHNNLTSSMHTFPNIYSTIAGAKQIDNVKMIRCRLWLQNSGNETLLRNNLSALHNRFFLCNDHFLCSEFMEKQSKSLKRNAVPSLFSCEPISTSCMEQYDAKWNIQVMKSANKGITTFVDPRRDDINNNNNEGLDSVANVIQHKHSNNNIADNILTEDDDSNHLAVENIAMGQGNVLMTSTESASITSRKGRHAERGQEVDAFSDHLAVEDNVTLLQSTEQSNVTVETNSLGNRQNKAKQTKRQCAAKGCTNTSVESSMFHFPKVLDISNGTPALSEKQFERLVAWIKGSGDKSLLHMHPDVISKRYFLCNNHFTNDSFQNLMKKRLKPHAVPTIFNAVSISEDLLEKYKEEICIWKERLFPHDYFESFEKCANAFEEAIHKLKWITCEECKERFLSSSSSEKCLHNNKCWEYSDINNMDPGTVPLELQDMSFAEQQLISLVHPLISVFKLKGLQYGYHPVNVINFFQDVDSFAKELPHNIKDLSSVINVRVHSKKNKNKIHDFHVRSGKILSALLWLKGNNPFYKGITISQENLGKLPRDGNIFEDVQTIEFDSQNCDLEATESDDDDDEHADISCDDFDEGTYNHSSCVPVTVSYNQDDQVKASLNWPTLSTQPVDEFNTVGYIACAFPTLFPYGKADLRDSRVKQIYPSNYFKHLLRFHDGRFAQHPTFRFFAYNSWMRWTALTDGNIFIKNNPEFKNMTAGTLKEKVKENPNTLKKIMFQASNLRGSKAFWHARANELRDMINALGLPTIFLTLSCADGHWTDLYKLLTGKEDVSNLTETERRKLIQDNPHIVDIFFDYRIKMFIKHILEKHYKVIDYWYRIEYQHRGSPHLHGVFWFQGAPDVSNLENESPEKLEEVLNYFSNLISAVNPDLNAEEPDIHPCRIVYSDITDFEMDVAQLLHRVQRHTKCSVEYCLRINKKTKLMQCRFKFPVELQDHCTLEKSESGELEFKPTRNDPLLNKFNKQIIQLWRANIDISPVISKRALIAYLAKYISKCEVPSNALEDLVANIINRLNDEDLAKKAIQRLFMRSCAERDISAQEVCHILLSLKLYSSGGRKFIVINFSSKNWIPIVEDENDFRTSRNFLEKYRDRPVSLENVCLWDAACSYDAHKWSMVVKKNIVRVFPRLKHQVNALDNEQFYEQQCLLYIPWRDQEHFKCQNQSWEDIWKNNTNTVHVSSQNILDDCQTNEDEWETEDIDSGDEPEEEWMLLSRLCPTIDLPDIELGRRIEDLSFDWAHTYDQYQQYGTLEEFQCFLDKLKEKESPVSTGVIDLPQIHFSHDQQVIVDLMNKQIKNILDDSHSDLMKKVIVQGKAGTGKSFLIKCLTSSLRKNLGDDSFVLATPTGVSAILINGKTLHSVFCLPKNWKNFKPLTGERARNLCNMFSSVKFLLLDEYSMIGCQVLAMIHLRCIQATGNSSEDFGGLHVYLFGDIKQLPPVKDSSYYSLNQTSVLAKLGKALSLSFQKIFVLSTCHRQQDKQFIDLLDNISNGKFSNADYQFLSERFVHNVSKEEELKFADAIRLFSTCEEVNDFNLKKLNSLKDDCTNAPIPIARIPAKHNNATAKKGTSDDAEGLDGVIYLSKGCKIMLRSNLWVAKGLVNGSTGKVVDILYDSKNTPPTGQPSVVLCQFDSYCGPGIIPNTNIIPTRPMVKSWTAANGELCTRCQFPLSLCYACSIHKSQGLTLDMAVVNIGPKEFALGLSYVALSRVRSLNKLLIYPFTMDRLMKLNDIAAIHRRNAFLSNSDETLDTREIIQTLHNIYENSLVCNQATS